MNRATRVSDDSSSDKYARFRLRYGRAAGGRAVIVPIRRRVVVASYSDLAPYVATTIEFPEASVSGILGMLMGHAHMETRSHVWAVLFERPSGSPRSRRRRLSELCKSAATIWAEINDLELREAEFGDRHPWQLDYHRTTAWIRDSKQDESRCDSKTQVALGDDCEYAPTNLQEMVASEMPSARKGAAS